MSRGVLPICHAAASCTCTTPAPLPVNDHAISSATAMTTIAMYPNNDTLGERLRLYVEENFHDA
jgi:hypothetical protein